MIKSAAKIVLTAFLAAVLYWLISFNVQLIGKSVCKICYQEGARECHLRTGVILEATETQFGQSTNTDNQ